jgi:hypothetical protein
MPGDGDVIAKVNSNLAERGVAVTEQELRAELGRAAVEARWQLMQP